MATRNKSPSMTQSQNVNINAKDAKEKININTCSKEALDNLPNIGEKLSQKIIDGRPYKDVFELKKIKGIGDSVINNIKEDVECE